MENNKAKKYDWLRMISTAFLLCALMMAMLYLRVDKVSVLVDELAAVKKNNVDVYPNLVWMIDFLSYVLPTIVLVTAVNIMYMGKDAYVKIFTQREKFWIYLALALFTFGGLLTYVLCVSGDGIALESAKYAGKSAAVALEAGDVAKTLWDKSYMWFFIQAIPMIFLLSYHSVRIGTETKEVAEEKANDAEKSANEEENKAVDEENEKNSEETE